MVVECQFSGTARLPKRPRIVDLSAAGCRSLTNASCNMIRAIMRWKKRAHYSAPSMGLPQFEQFDSVLDSGHHLIERGELQYAVDIVLTDGQVGSWQTHLAELGSVGTAANSSDVAGLR